MLTLTKPSCPALAVYVSRYRTASRYPECATWRASALAALKAHRFGRVDVVILSSWHFHQVLTSAGVFLTGAARTLL